MVLRAEFLAGLDGISREQWNSVAGLDYPFTRHEFLHGLEQTGCTSADTGWQPCHLVLRDESGTPAAGAPAAGEPVAVMPLYLKSHSYGEYVFDWSWADAWQRSGLHYYPKLLTAIPFTPAAGPRLCCSAGIDPGEAWDMALRAVQQLAREQEISSWHVLFPEPEVSAGLLQAGLHQRSASQFHWFNRGYADFDDFLSTLTSRKRKSLRRERRRVQEQGLQLRTLVGDEISQSDWLQFHRFYQLTYAKRSGHGGYLTREFFTRTAAGLGDQVIMVLACLGPEPVGGALYFRSSDTLYGRYWGCREEFDCLHFETCYYQGIEFCIANGLKRFDPGAQGEHKIQRGFQPVETFSNHWIRDPRLSAAVGDFTRRERRHIENYISAASSYLPFRET